MKKQLGLVVSTFILLSSVAVASDHTAFTTTGVGAHQTVQKPVVLALAAPQQQKQRKAE